MCFDGRDLYVFAIIEQGTLVFRDLDMFPAVAAEPDNFRNETF